MYVKTEDIEKIEKALVQIKEQIDQVSICVVELIIDCEATGGDPRYLYPLLKIVDSEALDTYLENNNE